MSIIVSKFLLTVKRSTHFLEGASPSGGSHHTNFRIHTLPVRVHLALEQMTRPGIKTFIVMPAMKQLSKSSIGTITRELCAVLNQAIEDKIIQENPASRVSRYFKQAPNNRNNPSLTRILGLDRLPSEKEFPIRRGY